MAAASAGVRKIGYTINVSVAGTRRPNSYTHLVRVVGSRPHEVENGRFALRRFLLRCFFAGGSRLLLRRARNPSRGLGLVLAAESDERGGVPIGEGEELLEPGGDHRSVRVILSALDVVLLV